MNIKIFSFQKNEELLKEWIEHHGYIFGYSNIYIIDHNSNKHTLDIYDRYKNNGLNVEYFKGEFKHKHTVLSKYMNNNNNDSDYLIPIDGDEFIFIKDGGNVSLDKNRIINHIQSYNNVVGKFKMNSYVNLLYELECDNVFNECDHFRRQLTPLDRMKTFYPTKYFINTDQGNHFGKISSKNDNIVLTDIILLHYARKGYTNYVKKLKKGIDAYNINTNTNKVYVGNGKHWHEQYELYKNNKLVDFFKKHYMYDLNNNDEQLKRNL